jgi:hypothetical protein
MKNWRTVLGILGIVASFLGCGGESSPSDPDDLSGHVDKNLVLQVGVKVSSSRVQPGETVTISATVEPVRAELLRFSWVNVTNHGRLVGEETGSVVGPFQIQWEAPSALDAGSIKIEVIQLVVTAVSQVVSVSDKGVQTSHDIASAIKTVPITITTAP